MVVFHLVVVLFAKCIGLSLKRGFFRIGEFLPQSTSSLGDIGNLSVRVCSEKFVFDSSAMFAKPNHVSGRSPLRAVGVDVFLVFAWFALLDLVVIGFAYRLQNCKETLSHLY